MNLKSSFASLAAAILLTACALNQEEYVFEVPKSDIKVNTPQDLAIESDDNYDNNEYGLITGARLKLWLDNWTANRPAHIAGRLIIFQVTAGPTGYEYIKSNPPHIYTYLENNWATTRSNGVIETQSMVLDGPGIDALLQKYAVDPTKDMIVLAQGAASAANVMNQGRAWYALYYWGVSKKHLALLNGGNQYLGTTPGQLNSSSYFANFAATAPFNGTFSVRQLKDDNFSLQATLEDVLRIAKPAGQDVNDKTDGIFLWDAREIGQYSAGVKREGTGTGNCQSVGYCDENPDPPYNHTKAQKFQNSASRQGHINGAVQLNFNHLLDSTKGFSWKSKAVLKDYLNGKPDSNGYGFKDGTYTLLGEGNAYQPGDVVIALCETAYRAMISGIAAGVILGYPTRFYDGSMIEWNSLSYVTAENDDIIDIVPADSPWRTDTKSVYHPAASRAAVGARVIVNPWAKSANKVIEDDRAYKNGGRQGGGSGGPANPCG